MDGLYISVYNKHIPDYEKIEEKFGINNTIIFSCPECDDLLGDWTLMIPHLNNSVGIGGHGYTFKQIGQYLKEQGY